MGEALGVVLACKLLECQASDLADALHSLLH